MQLTLVPIDRQGSPAEVLPDLPAEALDVGRATRELYDSTRYVPPWLGYYAVEGKHTVGTCGFNTRTHGDPSASGVAELAYFTFPEHEGRGVATAMAGELVRIAREAQPDVVLLAYTEPERNASTSILEKLGFVLEGTAHDDDVGEVWKWRLSDAVG